MIRNTIQDWKDAVYYLENNTGYFEVGEVRERVAERVFFWLILFSVSCLIISASAIGIDIGIRPIIANYLGSFGAVLLAIAPLRKEINEIHFMSKSPDAVRKDMMPKPVIRNLNRIIDRTLGLILVALAFFLQIFL